MRSVMSKVKDQRERAKLTEYHKRAQTMASNLKRAKDLLKINVEQTHKINSEKNKLQNKIIRLEMQIDELEYKIENDYKDHFSLGDPVVNMLEQVLWGSTSPEECAEIDDLEEEIRLFGYLPPDEGTTTSVVSTDSTDLTDSTDPNTQTTFEPPKKKKGKKGPK